MVKAQVKRTDFARSTDPEEYAIFERYATMRRGKGKMKHDVKRRR